MELNKILDDINLTVSFVHNEMKVYCEDARAAEFVRFLLTKILSVKLEQYMKFVDVDLGWTNYIQLVEKSVPEFTDNIIVLDGDVPENIDYDKPVSRPKRKIVEEAGNFLFLPLVIERDLFVLMKDPRAYARFEKKFLMVPEFTYEKCFASWPLEPDKYNTDDFKQWFERTANMAGGQLRLFDFWCSENCDKVAKFVKSFVDLFNELSERKGTDAMPGLSAEEIV